MTKFLIFDETFNRLNILTDEFINRRSFRHLLNFLCVQGSWCVRQFLGQLRTKLKYCNILTSLILRKPRRTIRNSISESEFQFQNREKSFRIVESGIQFQNREKKIRIGIAIVKKKNEKKSTRKHHKTKRYQNGILYRVW